MQPGIYFYNRVKLNKGWALDRRSSVTLTPWWNVTLFQMSAPGIFVVAAIFVVATVASPSTTVLQVWYRDYEPENPPLYPICDYPIYWRNYSLPHCFSDGSGESHSYAAANHSLLEMNWFQADQCQILTSRSYLTTEECLKPSPNDAYYYLHAWDNPPAKPFVLPSERVKEVADKNITIAYFSDSSCTIKVDRKPLLPMHHCIHDPDWMSYSFEYFRNQGEMLVAYWWQNHYSCDGVHFGWLYLPQGNCTYVQASQESHYWIATWN